MGLTSWSYCWRHHSCGNFLGKSVNPLPIPFAFLRPFLKIFSLRHTFYYFLYSLYVSSLISYLLQCAIYKVLLKFLFSGCSTLFCFAELSWNFNIKKGDEKCIQYFFSFKNGGLNSVCCSSQNKAYVIIARVIVTLPSYSKASIRTTWWEVHFWWASIFYPYKTSG